MTFSSILLYMKEGKKEMKKKVLSLFLSLVIILTMFTPQATFAKETVGDFDVATFTDLLEGERYGVFPYSWYTKKDIHNDQITTKDIRILIAGMRKKILKTNMAEEIAEPVVNRTYDVKVQDVLDAYYSVLTSYKYTYDIGFDMFESSYEFLLAANLYHPGIDVALDQDCTFETAMGLACRFVTFIYSALDAGSKGFLWVIESGENKVYLLGSIHIASTDMYPFCNNIKKAFAEADETWFEINLLLPEINTNVTEDMMFYTDGTTLKDHVSPEVYEKTLLAVSVLGMTEEDILPIKPVALWSLLSTFVYVGEDNENSLTELVSGIDQSLLYDASMYGKKIGELEGYELQSNILNSFSDELNEMLLYDTVSSFIDLIEGKEVTEKTGTSQDSWEKAWIEGDVDAFLSEISWEVISDFPVITEEEEAEIKELSKLMDEYKEKLITNRDIAIADKIDKMLKADGSTTYFIVIGAGHYISDYSVIDILEEKGYTVTQIK